MQLNITTDYAIRIVFYLATEGGIASSKEICEKTGVPQNYVAKINRNLTKAGITQTHVGVLGGFSLAKAPENISLLDIINTMENKTKINQCLEEGHHCSQSAMGSCPVRKFYCSLQKEMDEKMSSITMKRLIENS